MKTQNEFENYLNSIKQMAAEAGFDSLDEIYVEHLRARYFEEDVVIGRTSRVILRELKMTDLESLYRPGRSDWKIRRWWCWRPRQAGSIP